MVKCERLNSSVLFPDAMGAVKVSETVGRGKPQKARKPTAGAYPARLHVVLRPQCHIAIERSRAGGVAVCERAVRGEFFEPTSVGDAVGYFSSPALKKCEGLHRQSTGERDQNACA